MEERRISIVVIIMILFSLIFSMLINIPVPVKSSTTIYVGGYGPGNYTLVQDAIDNASDGDTVFVYAGIYYNPIIINKSINLIGESWTVTTLFANGSRDVVKITQNRVNISGFTMIGTGNIGVPSGIKLKGVSYCNIFDNNISKIEVYGLFLQDCTQISIINNILYKNTNGIALFDSVGIKFANNTLIEDGIRISGDSIEYWNTHEIEGSNTVNGKPFCYFKDRNGGVIPQDAGQVILANCTNMTIEDLEMESNEYGIQLGFSSNNYILNNNVKNNRVWPFGSGIQCKSFSNYNMIINNTLINNTQSIRIISCKNNTIRSNTISYSGYGIFLISQSVNNNMSNNYFYNTYNGIYIGEGNSNSMYNNSFVYNGEGNCGIRIYTGEKNIICDNVVEGYLTGLVFNNNDLGIISHNVLKFNNNSGISLKGSDNNEIFENNLSNNEYGIYVINSDSNKIENNTNSYSEIFGVDLKDSWKNTLKYNTLIDSELFIEGNYYNHWKHSIDITNTVNGKPIYLLENKGGIDIPLDAGQIILLDCNDIDIDNLNLGNRSVGIQIFQSNFITISNSNFSKNYYGIYIVDSENISIQNNILDYIEYYGIYLQSSSYNKIINNSLLHYSKRGIFLEESSHFNYILNNRIINNSYGIFISKSDYNVIEENLVSNNNKGIQLARADNNTISSNIISFNGYGMYIESSSDNLIINNTFNDNEESIYEDYYSNNQIDILPEDEEGAIIFWVFLLSFFMFVFIIIVLLILIYKKRLKRLEDKKGK